MAFSVYDAVVPTLTHSLGSMSGFLTKAETHAKEKGIDPKTYLEARLIEDMFALTRQVQVASDNAKGGVARLTGMEPPKYEDTEASFEDLRARIKKTIAFIKSVPAKSFEGAETRAIQLKFPNAEFNFTGKDYVTNWLMPNYFFHTTAAYAILRAKGVPLGKPDFLKGE